MQFLMVLQSASRYINHSEPVSYFHASMQRLNNPRLIGQGVISIRRLQRKTLTWELPDFFGLGCICIEPGTSRTLAGGLISTVKHQDSQGRQLGNGLRETEKGISLSANC